MPTGKFRRGCAAVFSARFAGRKNVRLPFSCARKCPKASAFPPFFSAWRGGGKKKTATEKVFSYRRKNADTASENTRLRPTDLPKRISEMKQKNDEILRKSYGKNIQNIIKSKFFRYFT